MQLFQRKCSMLEGTRPKKEAEKFYFEGVGGWVDLLKVKPSHCFDPFPRIPFLQIFFFCIFQICNKYKYVAHRQTGVANVRYRINPIYVVDILLFLGIIFQIYCVSRSEEGLLRSFRLIERLQSSWKEIDCCSAGCKETGGKFVTLFKFTPCLCKRQGKHLKQDRLFSQKSSRGSFQSWFIWSIIYN